MISGNYPCYISYQPVKENDKLFDEKKYEGRKITELDNDVLIKAIIKLVENASSKKEEFELELLSDEKQLKKYKSIFKFKDTFILELARKDAIEWVKELPLYKALVSEVKKRKLDKYLEIVLERREK